MAICPGDPQSLKLHASPQPRRHVPPQTPAGACGKQVAARKLEIDEQISAHSSALGRGPVAYGRVGRGFEGCDRISEVFFKMPRVWIEVGGAELGNSKLGAKLGSEVERG